MEPVRRRPERDALAAIAIAWAAVGLTHVAAAPAGGAATPALWAAMSAAMMGPAALPAARHVALNSLRRRRRRAVLTFLAGYVAVWAAFGLLALPAARLMERAAGPDLALAAVLAVAALWQLLPYRRRCLRACRRTVPLRPRGWRAVVACLHFAIRYGRGCVAACWPLMLAMALLLHAGLAWMIALTAAAALTRGIRRSRAGAAGLAAAAAAIALIAPLPAGAATSHSDGRDARPAWRCVLG